MWSIVKNTIPRVFLNLTTKTLPEKYDIQWVSDIISRNPNFQYIAQMGSEPIACILGSVISSGRQHSGIIVAIGVLSEYRNQGIGEALIRKVLQSMGLSGINRVLLHVKTDNISAITLYSKIGFKIIETNQNYYSDGSDAYTMEIRAKGEL
jgi:ribosomal protein S18 acetylase RimI-like enzyme